jgi:hypothetical protein
MVSVMSKEKVHVIKISRSRFLSVKKLLPHIQNDKVVKQYLPDLPTMTTNPPEKRLFIGLITTLKKDELFKLEVRRNARVGLNHTNH